ncbi:DNA excision repair protein ERCC-6-like 2 isoform X2 [Pleurodeles waltl]|uniref:DNA excision repair protein ERCC-6-like 2 isoform X2 n=1 Tax=Pleurodeles waltl TaxID=8319 RepID=UPI0037097A90
MTNKADQWNIGDKVLAPFSDTGKLSEARIHSIKTGEHGDAFAVVLFSNSEKKKIPVTELYKVQDSKAQWKSGIFDDEDLEKPFFPDKRLLGPAIAFKLSESGDSVPYTANRYLRDYQREGVMFMYKHYVESRGCILGDDMGLGKTVQVISLLAALLHKKGTREDIENNMPEFLLRTMKRQSSPVTPKKMFLIVAPLSVLYNWKDELDTWGYFRVITLHGNKKDTSLNRVKQGKSEIVLTTYETLRLCLDELNSIEWSAVIVDEAHRIKNPKAQVTQSMKDLNCKVRIGLTGTILQNNMDELWCVLDWAVPGCLGSRAQFKEQFSSPVEYGQRHNATKRELATGRKVMQRLVRKMSAFFLRRTKAIISNQLPKKEDRIVYCSLTDFQRAVYQSVLEMEDVSLVLRAREPCSCGSGRKRKNCCYKDTLIKRVCTEVFAKFPEFVKQSKDAAFETISDPMYSGKMKVLQQLLNHFRKNKDKVLLFSFSTKLLDVLERYCMASGLDYRRLDGHTKPEERLKIVKEFNSTQDVNICLVSTMAGGLGLNFVGANVVVVFDPTWNPANDLQAIDRAYRIGQSRDVKVFRLISLGTVEEIVYLRQVYKQQLHCVVVGSENAKRYFEAVQGSKDHQGELFGIHNLFKLRARGSCLTRDILEREGQVESGFITAATRLREDISVSKLEQTAQQKDEEIYHLRPGREAEKDIFDFNSDSEEESKAAFKTKTSKNRASNANTFVNPKEQLTLLQCGFSKMLERADKTDDEDTGSDSSHADGKVERSKKSVSDKHNKNVKINAEKLTSETCQNEDCPKPKDEQDISRPKKNAPQLKVLSDSEEETDSRDKNSAQKSSMDFDVVMETECSSGESEEVLVPCQISGHQGKVPPKTGIIYQTTSDESEASDEEVPSVSERRYRQTASNELFFPNVRSFFKKTKRNSVNTSIKARCARNGDDISDESDDIDIAAEPQTISQNSSSSRPIKDKRGWSHCNKRHTESHSQTIETFSSSEEDLTTKKVRFSKRDHRQKRQRSRIQIESASAKPIKTTNLSDSIPQNPSTWQNTPLNDVSTLRKRADVGSLDRILDGVQEVAYIHSNQNVVGSSKAENHMSRRAVRDVFELKQFSQFPANVAVNISQESKELSDEDSSGKCMEWKSNEHLKESRFYATHPVIQRNKQVHQADLTTFLIGSTPRRIRRKQLEEMVSHFHMNSAEEFAEQIVRDRSEDRQQLLRDFYTSQWAELKDILTVQFPAELPIDVGKAEEQTQKSIVKSSKCNEGKSVLRAFDQAEDQSSRGAEDSCSRKHQNRKTVKLDYDSDTNNRIAEGRQLSNRRTTNSSSQKIEHTSEELMASPLPICKPVLVQETSGRRITENTLEIESPRRTLLQKIERNKAGCQVAEKNVIADLIGDTSILDDLFRSGSSSHTSPLRRPHSKPSAVKAKTRPKDFWDILNEQNDESLSKFTDISVVEEVCERASPTVPKKKGEWDTSLWKKNENFLWKKYDPRDDGDQGLDGI